MRAVTINFVKTPISRFFPLETGKISNILKNDYGERKLKIKFCTYNELLFLLIAIILPNSKIRENPPSRFPNSVSSQWSIPNSDSRSQISLPTTFSTFFSKYDGKYPRWILRSLMKPHAKGLTILFISLFLDEWWDSAVVGIFEKLRFGTWSPFFIVRKRLSLESWRFFNHQWLGFDGLTQFYEEKYSPQVQTFAVHFLSSADAALKHLRCEHFLLCCLHVPTIGRFFYLFVLAL